MIYSPLIYQQGESRLAAESRLKSNPPRCAGQGPAGPATGRPPPAPDSQSAAPAAARASGRAAEGASAGPGARLPRLREAGVGGRSMGLRALSDPRRGRGRGVRTEEREEAAVTGRRPPSTGPPTAAARGTECEERRLRGV